MDIIGKFIELVKEIYTFPFNWNEGMIPSESDWILSVIFGVLIYGGTAVVVLLILSWIYEEVYWYRHRQHCQHEECGHQWTTNVSNDDNDPNCKARQPCCCECRERHEKEAIQRRAENEPSIECPHGHGKMQKRIVNEDIILDRCEQCGGSWIEAIELKRIEDDSFEQGYNECLAEANVKFRILTVIWICVVWVVIITS